MPFIRKGSVLTQTLETLAKLETGKELSPTGIASGKQIQNGKDGYNRSENESSSLRSTK